MPSLNKSAFLFLWCGLVILLATQSASAQSPQGQNTQANDEFVIGMFSFIYSTFDEEKGIPYCDKQNFRVHNSAVTDDEQPSSQLNILKEDGFNTVQVYMPSNHTNSVPLIGSLIGLAARNGMKILLNAQNFYHPYSKDSGRNYFGNELDLRPKAKLPEYPCKTLPDYDYLFRHLYAAPPHSYVIWGHQISEEASYFHYYNKRNFAIDYSDTANSLLIEVPPQKIQEACTHLKSKLTGFDPLPNHKFVIMEAYHHGRIHDTRQDGEGRYNPQDYIKTVKADVFFEGSYVAFNPDAWYKVKKSILDQPHYLGPIWNIDYAKKYIPEVHKVINIERRKNAGMEAHFHSDTTLKNGNWLWFQAYQSVIKGVRGIWFWELVDTYAECDEKELPPDDITVKDRFTRKYFPKRYNQFVAHLAKEMAYLHQEGFFNLRSVINTKTEDKDQLGLIPPVKTYMKKALKDSKVPKKYHTEFFQESYGIQYTIRTNGKDTLLILSNPVNVVVSLNLEVQKVFPGRTKAEVLFTREIDPLCKNYKTKRDSEINLDTKQVKHSESLNVDSKGKINCIFAPFDVWVVKIKK